MGAKESRDEPENSRRVLSPFSVRFQDLAGCLILRREPRIAAAFTEFCFMERI
jgi:hypothetical protein